MKKRLLLILFALLQMASFSYAGDGTASSPYTVAEALALAPGATLQWVQGYIVGGRYDDFAQPWDNNYAVSIADNPTETDINNCIEVKLEIANDHRATWGLNSNPGNFGKLIKAHGFRDTYGGKPSFEGVDDVAEVTGGGGGNVVENPVFSPVAGNYTSAQTITITCATADANIYYTTDGSAPTNASTRYTAPIALNVTTTLKAIAYTATENSNVTTGVYNFEISTADATLPYVQHFTTDEGNFTLYSSVGTQQWHWGNFDGGSMVMSGYENAASNDNTDWLLTPTFNFSGYSNLGLTFSEAINYITSFDNVQVLASTDYVSGDPALATWDILEPTGRSSGSSWSFVSTDTLDLDLYSGEENVTIAFKYSSSAAGSATWEISKVIVTGTPQAVEEPSNHATNFTAVASTITQTSIELTWTENSGTIAPTGYLIKASTATITAPVNGTDPAVDSNLTDGSGNVKVNAGTTTYTFNNCSPGTTYHFAIYPYNGSGNSIVFKAANAPSTNATTKTSIEKPASFTASTVSTSEIDLSWTKNTNGNDVLIAMNPYDAVSGNPTIGSNYEVGSTLPGGGIVIYKGSATTFKHLNLEANSYYHYKIWSANSNVYSDGQIANASTLANEPTYHATQFTVQTSTLNGITLNWINEFGDNVPDGYLILVNKIEANLLIPVDFTDISGDLDLSDGNGAAKVASNTQTYTWNNLTEGTTYYFSIYPYNNSGTFIDFKIENAPLTSGTTIETIASPYINPVDGTYNDSVEITINCRTLDAQIYYTTDGTTPNVNSDLYTEPFVLTQNSTIKAIAIKNISSSAIVQRVYTIFNTQVTVQTPVIIPVSETYSDSVEVTITCATPNAEIYYTIDGSVPGTSSLLYSGPFKLYQSATVKTIATLNSDFSELAETSFTVIPEQIAKPIILPEQQEFEKSLEVTISCATAGASIYYTIDGSAPNTQSTKYKGAITITTTTTINAVAVKNGIESETATTSYKLKEVAVPINVSNLSELRAGKTDGTIYHLTGTPTVTFAMDYRKQKYIQDATAAILIDDNAGKITTNFAIGDGIIDLYGTLYDYYGLLEFIPTQNANITTGSEIKSQLITISDLNQNFENYESELIKITPVTFADAGIFANGIDYVISNTTGNSILRTHFYNTDLTETTIPSGKMEVTGIALWHKNAAKIVPRSLADLTVATGIDDLTDNINVWAKPCTIVIETSTFRNSRVNIYNVTGAKVATVTLTQNQTEIAVPRPGLYLLELLNKGTSSKVLKIGVN